MTPRERFQTLLDELRTPLDTVAAQAAMEEEVLDLHRERFPRRKASRNKIPHEGPERWPAIRKLGEKTFPEDFTRICDEHSARWKTVLDARGERVKQIKTELATLADDLAPQPSDEARKVYDVNSSSYHTQGFGAASYARNNAKIHARDLEFHGIEVEVREVTGETFKTYGAFGRSVTPVTFEVWAKCSDLDYQIARYKEGMTLAQQLQWCWNRQVNPRVYYPMLPHGLEERLGVSFQPVRDSDGNLSP